MKFLMVFLALITTHAFAVEMKIAEIEVDDFRPNAKSYFVVDKNTSLAYVEVETSYGPATGDSSHGQFYQKIEVPGLEFDATQSKITLTHEGQLFECANVVNRWFGSDIRPTGCKLKISQVLKNVNGSHRKELFHQIFLITK